MRCLALLLVALLVPACANKPPTSYGTEVEARVAEQLPKRFNVVMSDGHRLWCVTFHGKKNILGKDFLILKDICGKDHLVRIEHIAVIE